MSENGVSTEQEARVATKTPEQVMRLPEYRILIDKGGVQTEAHPSEKIKGLLDPNNPDFQKELQDSKTGVLPQIRKLGRKAMSVAQFDEKVKEITQGIKDKYTLRLISANLGALYYNNLLWNQIDERADLKKHPETIGFVAVLGMAYLSNLLELRFPPSAIASLAGAIGGASSGYDLGNKVGGKLGHAQAGRFVGTGLGALAGVGGAHAVEQGVGARAATLASGIDDFAAVGVNMAAGIVLDRGKKSSGSGE